MQLCDIKGIGNKRAETLNKQGFSTPLDLLYFFPYAYVDAHTPSDLHGVPDGQAAYIRGTVKEKNVRYVRKGLHMVRAKIETAYGDVHCTWFNQKFIAPSLVGEVGVYGTVEHFKSAVSLKAPILIRGDGVIPLYRPIKGVPSSVLRAALEAIVSRVSVKSVIPETITSAFGLPDLNACFRQLHFPTDTVSATEARRAVETVRLSYELACFRLLKSSGESDRQYTETDAVEKFIASLPYRLTDGQRQATDEILSSMRAPKTMNRLLQGDVGCGKTIVAFIAMLYAVTNGYQAALMSPTELLALQHYRTALELFRDMPIRVAYLSGSLSAKERDDVLFHVRHGDVDMLIGTHALLHESVRFNRLALTVIDEQHRFGVHQRAALQEKAQSVDTLVMSATPIPRTVALTYYGDLEQSSIREVPARKAKILTRLVPPRKKEDMFRYLLSRAEAGEGAYIVCPRVDDEAATSATALYKELLATPLAPYLALLHGKQKEAEKRDVMQAFASGAVRILVTTTVVEVGIDVPQATSMVILDAERYGLSQLHQLRGRVGRGDKDSYCFLMTEGVAPERLDFFVHCDDGFRLAEYDFQTRGAGDFLGTRQHGDGFKVTIDTMETARKIADAAVADKSVQEDIGRFTADEMRYITLN